MRKPSVQRLLRRGCVSISAWLVLLLAEVCSVFCTTPFVVVLGIAQDAGAPQMGCMSAYCTRAWRDPSLRKTVSSIALVDPSSGARWFFDATPDMPEQFELLKEVTGDPSNRVDGIFLTHAHIGHYTGLMYLGRESMDTRGVKVYAMPRMRQVLEDSAPWSQLVRLQNINIEGLNADSKIGLTDAISVTPFKVPHRDEFSETVGFRIQSSGRSLVYVPDIDKWGKWDRSLLDLVRANDYVLIDGTFYADGEIGRAISEVPHPFVSETMDLLASLPAAQRKKVLFIHLNHTNPLLQGDKKKLRELHRKGYGVAFAGQRIAL